MTFMSRLMKVNILMCALIAAISLSAHASTSAQEKAFIDKYKTAFEGKDTATLESFLYTQGADPAILKKLSITIEKKDANGSSSSSTENSIAEKDGEFVIPFQGRINKGPSVRGRFG